MKKVWCVFEDYGHEGKDLQIIFMNEADADVYINQYSRFYHLEKEEFEIY